MTDAELNVLAKILLYGYLSISLFMWALTGIYVGSIKSPPKPGNCRELDWLFFSFFWPFFVCIGILGLPFFIGKLLKRLFK